MLQQIGIKPSNNINCSNEINVYPSTGRIILGFLAGIFFLVLAVAPLDYWVDEIGLPNLILIYLFLGWLCWIFVITFTYHLWGEKLKRHLSRGNLKRPLARLTRKGLYLPTLMKMHIPWHEISNVTVTTRSISVGYKSTVVDQIRLSFKTPQKLKMTANARLSFLPNGWFDDFEFLINKMWPLSGEQFKELILASQKKWQLPETYRPTPANLKMGKIRSHSSFTYCAEILVTFKLLPLVAIFFIASPKLWFDFLGNYTEKGFKFARKGNEKAAVDVFKLSASLGDNLAQTNLGNLYRWSAGVELDKRKAIYWYKRSAGQGNTFAQKALGDMYLSGEGTPQDYSKAVKWVRQAAKNDNANAQYNLGVMYQNGQGVTQDYSEAMKWYRKAAEHNFGFAQLNVGVLYFKGQGVEQDITEAIKWYRKAARQRNAIAQKNLGDIYFSGIGVKQDFSESLKFYNKAAKRGNSESQYKLGTMYANGNGTSKDLIQAYKWLSLPVDRGEKKGKELLKRISKNMSPEQLELARKLVQEWRLKTK